MKKLLRKGYHFCLFLQSKARGRGYRAFGIRSKIIAPIHVYGKRNISIGNRVEVMNGIYLETDEFWSAGEGMVYHPRIEIKDDVSIGAYCHITCAGRIIIGKGVSIMPQVLITDIEHQYRPGHSLRETGLDVGEVIIGDFTSIGMGARILGHRGIRIGKNCVIGANAVVTKDIPDDTVVAGVPAHETVKQLCQQPGKWERASECL